MKLLKLDTQNVKGGDLIVIPRGYGKHRGKAEDSGLIEVFSACYWPKSQDVTVDGRDLEFLSQINMRAPFDMKVEVLRRG